MMAENKNISDEKACVLIYSEIDSINEIDNALQLYSTKLSEILKDISDDNRNQMLCNIASKSTEDHNMVQMALLHQILINQSENNSNYSNNSELLFRDLTTSCRDNFIHIFKNLRMLIADNMYQMKIITIKQLIWIIDASLKNNLHGIDGLVYNFSRSLMVIETTKNGLNCHQVASEGLLDIINGNKDYFLNHQHLLRDTLTTILNIIPMHCNNQSLLYKEISIARLFLTARFNECLFIGRDLIRFLVSVANISGINSIWNDIVHNPMKLSSTFSEGIASIIKMPCSKHLTITCLTQPLEHYIYFILGEISHKIQKNQDELENKEELVQQNNDYLYYLKWLDSRFLTNASKVGILRSNILRFVLYHNLSPNNSIFSFKINNNSNKNNTSSSTSISGDNNLNASIDNNNNINNDNCNDNNDILIKAKAVFIDWLLAHPNSSNDANFKLTMIFEMIVHDSNSLEPSNELAETWRILRQIEINNINIIQTIRDFIPVIVKNFIPQYRDLFNKNIVAAINLCYNSLPIESFKPYLTEYGHKGSKNNTKYLDKYDRKFDTDKNQDKSPGIENAESPNLVNNFVEAPKIDNDDILSSIIFQIESCDSQNVLLKSIQPHLPELTKVYENIIDELFDPTKSCNPDSIDTILIALARNDAFQSFKKLYNIFKEKNNTNYFLSIINGLNKTIYDLTLLLLLFDIYFKENRVDIGYKDNIGQISDYFTSSEKFTKMTSIYYQYLNDFYSTQILDKILDDLKNCSLKSYILFLKILKPIYNAFGDILVEDNRFMHLIAGTLDSSQVKSLRQQIIMNQVNLLPNDDIVDLIDDSLGWESIEQFYFWQILLAHHNIPLDQIWQIIPDLEWELHSEAINSIALLLKFTNPQLDIMKCLFSRQKQQNQDDFVVLVLEQWRASYKSQVLEALEAYLLFLQLNTRIESRNISSTLSQLYSLYQNSFCSYIFESTKVLESLLVLIVNASNNAEDTKQFKISIQNKLKQIK